MQPPGAALRSRAACGGFLYGEGGTRMEKRAAAIVLAAGQGKRMAAGCNKQFLTLGGLPVLAQTLAVFEACSAIDYCIVVARAEECAYCQKEIVERYQLQKVQSVVAGGAERQDSVYQGLLALPKDYQYVAVHDGARPLVTEAILQRVLAAVEPNCGAVPGVPVKDTIKRTDAQGLVLETPPRASLWSVQTPQIFAREQLMAAYEAAQAEGYYGTDDASLVEHQGGAVRMVMGSYENIKLTTPEDLPLAENILRSRIEGEK